MSPAPDHLAMAAKCRQLSEQTTNEEDRDRWLSMERFWLRQTGPGKMTPASEPEFIIL